MNAIKITAAVSVLLCLTVCSKQKLRGVEGVQKKGELVLYTNAAWPPFEYLDEEGNIEGVDIDICRSIARNLGVQLRIIDGPFNMFPEALRTGEADIAAAAISITEERAQEMSFSNSYATTIQYIVTLKNAPVITSLKDLEGRRIGVEEGTTSDALVSVNIRNGALEYTNAEILRFKTSEEAVKNLLQGDPFAFVCDEARAKTIAAANNEIVCVPVNSKDKFFAEEEYYGIAVAKDNETLLGAINKTLDEFTGSGELYRIINNHTAKTSSYKKNAASSEAR
ncbi:MAG: transporter substrate-binding domain-containing protein [Spirochaetaceae bacterium]|nr:transporter substrate-binding domain-containing protein [Spirochaetaceae bacterium]